MRPAVSRFSRSTLARVWLSTLLLAAGMPTAARGDVTINTAVSGPVNGDGGAFTVTTSGTIGGVEGGIVSSPTSAITALTVDGVVDVFSPGLLNTGTITSFDVASTGLIQASGGTGVQNEGAIAGTLANAGTLAGWTSGLFNGSAGQISAVVNSGTVTANGGLANSGTIGSVTNQTTGLFYGVGSGISVLSGAGIGTLDNAGTINCSLDYYSIGGLANAGVVTSLINSGTVNGSYGGLVNQSTGLITSATNSGVISGDWAVKNTGTLTALANTGSIDGNAWGVIGTSAGSSFGTVTNHSSGTIRGASNGIGIYGTGGTISNAGLVQGTSQYGVYVEGGLTLLTNSGTVSAGAYGVQVAGAGSIGTITNSGTISGGNSGVLLIGTSGTMSNQAGARIEAATADAVYLTGTTSLVSNAGTISAGRYGAYVSGSLTQLANSGTVSAGAYGVNVAGTGSIATTTNSGLLSGGQRAFQADAGTTIGTITNSGTMSGGDYGVLLYGTTDTVSNQAGGRIEATTTDALYLTGPTGLVSNAGTISAGRYGVYVTSTLSQLANSGVISGSPAVRVDTGGVLTTLTNSGSIGAITSAGRIGDGVGLAIESTGVGSVLGVLTNSGTIQGGMTVANQDLVVNGGTGGISGRFMGSDITVLNGDLTFASGATRLDSDVVVSSSGGTAGAGTMTNQGELILGGATTLDGAFVQSAAGIFTTALSTDSIYGSLSASGAASFGGYLNLAQSGLSLADGQTFGLFSFLSSSGGFLGLSVDGTSLSSLGGGDWAYGSLILSEKWTSTTMGLQITASTPVPEIDPAGLGSVLALVTGALGLLERRRSKRA